MYLIDVERFQSEGSIQLKHFLTTPVGKYAILSHTWGEDEVLFDDLIKMDAIATKKGLAKIQFTCAQAWCDGLQYAWIDTCCIDKTSSSELSEAINSMYSWYKSAAICYVYLEDLGASCPRLFEEHDGSVCSAEDAAITQTIANESAFDCQLAGRIISFIPVRVRFRQSSRKKGKFSDEDIWLSRLSKCRWFTRGWTLQELIAPQQVVLFGCDWNPVGCAKELIHTLSHITGVDPIVHSCDLEEISVAKRLSWASRRQTSRLEDTAYCLLGLLDINMALLYGEGDKAFARLQEEIIRTSADSTLFAWCRAVDNRILAPSPSHFQYSGKILLCRGATINHSYEKTHRGIRMRLPLLKFGRQTKGEKYLAILSCRLEDDFYRILTLHLSRHTEDPTSDSDAILCSIDRCTQECVDSGMQMFEPPFMHTINTKKAESARYRTVLIPRHNFRDQMNLSGLWHTLPVWVRTLPQPLEVVDGFPPHQWNLETRVMSNYQKMEWESFQQSGGLLLKSRNCRFAICFAVGHQLEFIKVSGMSRKSFREEMKNFDISARDRHVMQRRAMHHLGTQAIGHSTRLQATLKQDTVLGQDVWIIEISLLG